VGWSMVLGMTFMADTLLRAALTAVHQGGDELHQALDTLPVPIYVTGADGLITYYNRACTAFAGRVPRVGRDSWCVTWKLFTGDGEPLPHDQCPMAVAIQERRPVRGIEAIAERPDGTRVNFIPYPTPLFDEDGALVGAVNMFIDTTAMKQAQALRLQAIRCRRLASGVGDARTINTLNSMADEYEEKARAIKDAQLGRWSAAIAS
jgi:PAS domain-containing protein